MIPPARWQVHRHGGVMEVSNRWIWAEQRGQTREEEEKRKQSKAAAINLCFDGEQSDVSLFCFWGPDAYYGKDCTQPD